MFLRESGHLEGIEINPLGLINKSVSTEVPQGDILIEFCDSVLGKSTAKLNKSRNDLHKALGSQAVSAASAIIGNFTKNDRIANGLGIPLPEMVMKQTNTLRDELGLNRFGSAMNSLRLN